MDSPRSSYLLLLAITGTIYAHVRNHSWCVMKSISRFEAVERLPANDEVFDHIKQTIGPLISELNKLKALADKHGIEIQIFEDNGRGSHYPFIPERRYDAQIYKGESPDIAMHRAGKDGVIVE